MNISTATTILSSNLDRIRSLVYNVPDAQARWKPSPDAWSILEVINHLYDEERDDFRRRLDFILHHPGQPWPPIDPPAWAIERKYNEQPWPQSLDKFVAERQKSLEWLHGLETADMDTLGEPPFGGTMCAGDMLSSWVAHDFLHMRQLNELHYAYVVELTGEYSVEYAGQW